MNDGDTIKNLHLYEDEETIQKTIHYLELHDPENADREYAVGISEIYAAICACCEQG